MRIFTSRAFLASTAAAVLLFGGFAPSAHAGYLVGTGVETMIVINGGSVTFSGAYTAGTGSSFINGGLGGSVTGTVDLTGLLMSAFDQSGLNIAGESGNSFAKADLSTGSLGVSATSTPGSPDVFASGGASYSDVLHFNINGAGPTTTTLIGIQFTLSGVLNGAPDSLGVSAISSFGIQQMGGPSSGAGLVSQIAYDPLKVTCLPCIFGQSLAYPGIAGPSGWASYGFTSNVAGSIVFSGMFALVGATPDVTIGNALDIQDFGGGNTADYSDTSTVGLTLPSGVTYTSDSGVFDTVSPGSGGSPGAAPEPASFALIGLGLLSIAVLRRRKA